MNTRCNVGCQTLFLVLSNDCYGNVWKLLEKLAVSLSILTAIIQVDLG